MTLRRLATATATLMLAAAGLLPEARAEEEKVLNVANWSEYIGEHTIADFERETGIRVRYDNFDSNDILLAKMLAGRTGYDIVVPSSDYGRMMRDAKLVRPLDRARLPHWGNLDPVVMSLMARLDPGNETMVPWLGGSVTVGYNEDQVRAALGGEPIPADPFELVFNPHYTHRLKACGISVLDSASDVFPSALIRVGRKAYSNEPADYEAAARMLQQVRGDIGLFSYNGYIDDLARGQVCVALGYGGDFNNARRRAQASRSGVHIVAPLPPGHVQFGFESMMVPADAPHPENAMKWIDFILRGEVQAAITNQVMFTSPNRAARAFIAPDVLANAIAFPPEDWMRSHVEFYEVRRHETRRLMTRLFTKFKSGV